MDDSIEPNQPPPLHCLKLPFIFVPHGAPPPLDWIAEHPGAVTVPATFLPRPPQTRSGMCEAGDAASQPGEAS